MEWHHCMHYFVFRIMLQMNVDIISWVMLNVYILWRVILEYAMLWTIWLWPDCRITFKGKITVLFQITSIRMRAASWLFDWLVLLIINSRVVGWVFKMVWCSQGICSMKDWQTDNIYIVSPRHSLDFHKILNCQLLSVHKVVAQC